MNIIEEIHQRLLQECAKHITLSDSIKRQISFTLNAQEDKQSFGDISTNAPLILAATLETSAHDIAKKFFDEFSHPAIKQIDVAGPGFLNITLKDEAFIQLTKELIKRPRSFFKTPLEKSIRYSLEFISANPTGPLHLGHGRGGIIGDVLCNILSFLTYPVTKEYYINDAGSQMQKLCNSFKIRYQQALGKDIPLPEDAYHGEYLVDLAKKLVKHQGSSVLHEPDDYFQHYAKDALLGNISKTLNEYGINFDLWFSEKRLHNSSHVQKAINELTEQGYTYKQDNALWFKSTEFGDDKDRVLIKSDGTMTYIAGDVAYTKEKFSRADKLIMILGQDHHSYVTRLKGIAQAFGYDPHQVEIILYQLITLSSGDEQLRMSKRAGTMITLKEVIDAVGKDVARFFFLHRKADAHLDFDLDLALKTTEENPVFYIQYAYVRAHSILNRAQQHGKYNEISKPHLFQDYLDSNERIIIKKIVSLKNLLFSISHNYQTHLLTYYTLELAKLFHHYYATHRAIDVQISDDLSQHRIAVILLFKEVFDCSLDLLGLSKPHHM